MSKRKDTPNEFINNWINNNSNSVFDKNLLKDLLEYNPHKEVPEALTRTVLIEKVSKIQNSIWEYTEKHLVKKIIPIYLKVHFMRYMQ